MKALNIGRSNIAGLYASSLFNLEELYASKSHLTYLDTGNAKALQLLDIRDTNISYINTTRLVNVEELQVGDSKLQQLDTR